MISKAIITEKGYADLKSIRKWYDENSVEAANRFLNEISVYSKKIMTSPFQCQIVAPGVRRSLLKTFPYVIYFIIERESIVLLRVRHKKQKMLKRFK